MYDDKITESPIIQELYFRDRFKGPKELLEQGQTQGKSEDLEGNRNQQLPITQNGMEAIQTIAQSRTERNVARASQEVKTGYREMENPEAQKNEFKRDD